MIKFIDKNPSACQQWGIEVYQRVMSKMEKMDLPSVLNTNILNPPLPLKNKVTNSIGLKRKEMLKYREYELYENTLKILSKLKSKDFLLSYFEAL